MQAKTHGLSVYPLKGILVGNGATDWRVDIYPAWAKFGYMHNLMDKDSYEVWKEDKCFIAF